MGPFGDEFKLHPQETAAGLGPASTVSKLTMGLLRKVSSLQGGSKPLQDRGPTWDIETFAFSLRFPPFFTRFSGLETCPLRLYLPPTHLSPWHQHWLLKVAFRWWNSRSPRKSRSMLG